jgi:hypothetical protein
MLLSCVALIVAAVGCGGKNYNNSGAQNRPITTAFIRVTNAISDSPILLAGLDGTTLTRVSYGQATGLQQVPSGKYALDVQYLDTNGNPVAVINKDVLDLTVNDQDTVYLLGTLDTLHTKLVENPAPAIAAGNAEVQVVQASSRAGSVDVYLTDAAADLATATKLASVAFEDATPLSTIPAGTNYRVRVTSPGTTTVLYDSGVFAIDDLSRVTFVVVDYFGPGGNGFRVLDQDSQVARLFPAEALPAAIRLANMIADQPSVDMYLGPVVGTPAFAGIAYGAIAPLQDVTAGALTYSITVAGTPATVLATATVNVTPGETRTVVATRSASGAATRTTVDATRPVKGQGQVQVVNAAPTALDVDAYFLTSGTTIDAATATIVDLPVLSFAAAVRAPASYDIAFTPTANKTTLAGPTAQDVADGGIYSVYLIDAPGGGAPYQIVVGSD